MAVIARPRRSKSPDCFHALPLCRLIIATGHKARQRVFGLCGLFERSSKYRFIFATVSHEPEPRDPREIGFNRRNRGFRGGVTWRMSKGQEMHGLKNLVTLGTCMGERPAMTSVPIWTCCSVLRLGGLRWGCGFTPRHPFTGLQLAFCPHSLCTSLLGRTYCVTAAWKFPGRRESSLLLGTRQQVRTDGGMNYSDSRGPRKHKRENLKEENVFQLRSARVS